MSSVGHLDPGCVPAAQNMAAGEPSPPLPTTARSETLALRRLGTQRDILGECPLWDDRRQCLWWVDIRAPALRCLDLQALDDGPDAPTRHWPLPDMVGSIALAEDGRLLLALSTQLCVWNPEDGALQTLARPDFTDPHHRFNDGRCDRQGRFWVGSMHNLTRAPEGRLFRWDPVAGLVEQAGGLCIPNSLAWSPDGRTMYFADSLRHAIEASDYDPDLGQPGPWRTLARSTPPGFPDGSAVDAQGYLWNAEFDGARLVRYAPDGRVDRVIRMPVRRPTCCAFGGQHFEHLFVTTTSQRMTAEELAAEPLAGTLLLLDVGVRGLPEPRVRLTPR